MSPETDIQSFHFRSIHPKLLMGTASDRYTGWLGQIYSPERYMGRIKRRTTSLPILCPELFHVLEDHGIGQVLSHWTWLPSLRGQFSLSGKRFFGALTPLIAQKIATTFIRALPAPKS